MNLYITADRVGEASGGGTVTSHEWRAFRRAGESSLLYDRQSIPPDDDPFKQDERAIELLLSHKEIKLPLSHFYAGCFSKAVKLLRLQGKTTYTAAAHDIDLSRRECEGLGLDFNLPHLTDPEQLKRYLAGYMEADVLICPSKHSADVMRKYGRTGRIEIIPHGVDLPATVKPMPSGFTVGYLGAVGPDKGLRYLLEAWKLLGWKDAGLLFAGKYSSSGWFRSMIERYGGGNVYCAGWVEDVSYFYNSINLYVQPSVTEGFGIEVLEAMSYGRPVLCSAGAGAADCVPVGYRFPAANSEVLAQCIDLFRSMDPRDRAKDGEEARERAKFYEWSRIELKYEALWKELLG